MGFSLPIADRRRGSGYAALILTLAPPTCGGWAMRRLGGQLWHRRDAHVTVQVWGWLSACREWVWSSGVDDRGVSGWERSSREELLVVVVAQARMLELASERLVEQAALIEEQGAALAEQAARIEAQAERIAELERKAGLSSRSSSTPPVRDGLDKPPVRSMREKGVRKAGKQPGAPGATLSQVDEPDRVERHFPSECGRCASPLDRDRVVGEVVRRQVFDMPEVKVEVTEHQMFALGCGCGHATRAEATAPACYGPNVTSVAAYLSAQHHIPFDRVVEIMADLAGVDLSAGFVVAACRRAQDAVAPANEAIKDTIAAAPTAHFDESVTRVAGRNHWLHTAATAELTAYYIDIYGRSLKAIKAFFDPAPLHRGRHPRRLQRLQRLRLSARPVQRTHSSGGRRDRRVRPGRPGGRVGQRPGRPARRRLPVGRALARAGPRPAARVQAQGPAPPLRRRRGAGSGPTPATNRQADPGAEARAEAA